MLAYLLVTDAPYFGRTDAQGRLVGGGSARPLPGQHLAPATAREPKQAWSASSPSATPIVPTSSCAC